MRPFVLTQRLKISGAEFHLSYPTLLSPSCFHLPFASTLPFSCPTTYYLPSLPPPFTTSPPSLPPVIQVITEPWSTDTPMVLVQHQLTLIWIQDWYWDL